MRLPTWAELESVPEQIEVLEWPLDKSLFVVGPPGSGKTVLAVHRAQAASKLDVNKEVAIITYNRMLRRLLTLLSQDDIKAVTMHSFFWNDYRRRVSMDPPQHEPYQYNWDLIERTLQGNRSNFSKENLIVDEGQDLPQGFFRYAARYVSSVVNIFADEDQALKEDKTSLEQIKSATGLNNPVILQRNHRNTPEISVVAEHFHSGRLPAATVLRKPSGERPRLVQLNGLDAQVRMVSNWYQTRGGNIGIIFDRKETSQVFYDELRSKLQGPRVDIYVSEKKNEESIELLEPGVTIVNKESVKGQEFDTVFILELENFIPCNNNATRRAMYMMCARARDNLFLVYGHDSLSQHAMAALPGEDILQRE